MRHEDDRESELQELRHEAQQERIYREKLALHPRCDDPDHPGCSLCEQYDQAEN